MARNTIVGVLTGIGLLTSTAGATPAKGLPIISTPSQLSASLSSVLGLNPTDFASAYPSLLSAIKPATTPTDVAQVTSALSSIYAANPTNALTQAAWLIMDGLAGGSLQDIVKPYPCDSVTNQNTRKPQRPVYPSKSSADAPYDFSEKALREAIYIPKAFKYGNGKQPILFIPGTGVTGCETYTPNYAKVLAQSSYADPVFLNVPGRMLDDEQNNAEFIAYAINYISGISKGSKVSIMAYSGGNTATQWALKYWPSTNSIVSDYLAISPDYHGTTLDFELCIQGTPCAPSVLQQEYESVFVQTLLNNGGDSVYVPTTAVSMLK